MTRQPLHPIYPYAFASVQEPISNIIVQAAAPSHILLLGASVCEERSVSLFGQAASPFAHLTHAWLLVLMPEVVGKECCEWQDTIETKCRPLLPLTTIVLPTDVFAEWIREQHPFALRAASASVSFYNSGQYPLPAIPCHEQLLPTEAGKKILQQGLERSKEFMAGTELYQLRQQHELAAFMLHQSTEQVLSGILQWGTGYHANTHSIDRLLRLARLVSPQLSQAFNLHRDEGKRLFGLLQKARSGACKHAPLPTISAGDLQQLMDCVAQLQRQAAALVKTAVPWLCEVS